MKTISIFLLTTLTTLTSYAQTEKCGRIINETWTAVDSPIHVTCTLEVASLEIQEGVRVIFLGNYAVSVDGLLTVTGTKEAPVFFTRPDSISGWGGIRFRDTQPGSSLKHVVIERATSRGLTIVNSFPEISYCTVRGNTNNGREPRSGGGIYTDVDLTLDHCVIEGNSAHANKSPGSTNSRGGGIFAAGHLTLINSVVSSNSVGAGAGWGSSFGYGGGIYAGGTLSLIKSLVVGNSASSSFGPSPMGGHGWGGGIFVSGNASIQNSIISNNSVSGITSHGGAGMYISNGTTNVQNSTVAYNGRDGLYIHSSADTTQVINSIFYFNGGSEIAGRADVTFSNVDGGYPGEGNIDFNPVFYGDKVLRIVPGSPSIDKGSPEIVYNDVFFPPSLGTVHNDQGAHGGPDPNTLNLAPPSMPVFSKESADIEFIHPFCNPDTDFPISWAASVDPDGAEVVYSWQLALENDFTSLFIDEQVGPETTVAIKPADLLQNLADSSIITDSTITMYHRVVAYDGELVTFSEVHTLKYIYLTAPTSAAAILSPEDKFFQTIGGPAEESSEDPSTPFTVEWDPSEHPGDCSINYTWQLAQTSNFEDILIEENTGSSTSYATTLSELAGILDNSGIALWDSLIVYHRVMSTSAIDTVYSPTFALLLQRGTLLGNDNPSEAFPLNLEQNFPNPFQSSSWVPFSLPSNLSVEINVYNLLGQRVFELIDETRTAGRHSIEVDLSNFPPGVYYYRLRAGDFTQTRKMILIR